MQRYGASQRRACAVLRISRSVYGYRSRARDARPLVARIKEIAATRVHYGYRRVHVLLRREGWKDNCKRAYRLYRAEGLPLRHCRPRRNTSRLRQPKQLVRAIDEIRSMDFVADAQGKIEAWRRYHKGTRPHSALAWSTPAEYARRARLSAESAVAREPEFPTSGRS